MIKNDIAAGEGINLSLFVQGCPLHCKGCHNPQTWDFDGGKEFNSQILFEQVIVPLSTNGVLRNFSLMGGEPLCKENIEDSYEIVNSVRLFYPTIKIYIWTGYTYEYLINCEYKDIVKKIFQLSNFLIDGPFELNKRDITLSMRGSTNQRIINLRENKI